MTLTESQKREVLMHSRPSAQNTHELDYWLIHQDRYAFMLDRISDLDLSKGAKILDIGCYPMHMFQMLEDVEFDMYGIASHHENVQGYKNIKICNIETEPIPFPDTSFDVVLFTEIMEHLLVAPRFYLSSIQSVLKHKGVLIITTPNAVHLKHRAQMVLGKNTAFSLKELDATQPGNGSVYFRHNREFTMGELTGELTANGWAVAKKAFFSAYTPTRTKLHPDPIYLWIIKAIGYGITVLYPSLRDTLYIEARL